MRSDGRFVIEHPDGTEEVLDSWEGIPVEMADGTMLTFRGPAAEFMTWLDYARMGASDLGERLPEGLR